MISTILRIRLSFFFCQKWAFFMTLNNLCNVLCRRTLLRIFRHKHLHALFKFFSLNSCTVSVIAAVINIRSYNCGEGCHSTPRCDGGK